MLPTYHAADRHMVFKGSAFLDNEGSVISNRSVYESISYVTFKVSSFCAEFFEARI